MRHVIKIITGTSTTVLQYQYGTAGVVPLDLLADAAIHHRDAVPAIEPRLPTICFSRARWPLERSQGWRRKLISRAREVKRSTLETTACLNCD